VTFPIRIAVVSDLHIGVKSRGRDLCPQIEGFQQIEPEEGYLDTFEAFVKGIDPVDLLLVPGDITNTAHPAEVATASGVIERLQSIFSLKREQVLIIPGNHDMDWALWRTHNPPHPAYARAHRYESILDPDSLFSTAFTEGSRHLCKEPYFMIREVGSFLMVGLNSAAEDTPDKRPHHGQVTPETLQQLDEELEEYTSREHAARILVLHHHPVSYTDPVATLADFSQLQNADLLLGLLQKRRFDLIVHGHKHSPHFKIHINEVFHPLVVLCAGSFSYQLESSWQGRVLNQFHMIEIDDRNGNNSTIRGRVRSWSYRFLGGWEPSQSDSAGIDHVNRFGLHMHPDELLAELEPFISNAFESRNAIAWTELEEELPVMGFAPEATVKDALERLQVKLSFRLIGTSPDKILVKI